MTLVARTRSSRSSSEIKKRPAKDALNFTLSSTSIAVVMMTHAVMTITVIVVVSRCATVKNKYLLSALVAAVNKRRL